MEVENETWILNSINNTTMDEFLYQSMDGMLTDMSHEFSSFMPASEVMEAVERVSDFFHIDNPNNVAEGFGTGVYTLDPTTMLDDILIYNPTQLESMGITGQDAVDLVMTHEGTHRMLQGMEVRFNSHQEELCCDYMAGIRAGLNNMDITQLSHALGETMESETHPAGFLRVTALEAGMEYARQFDQQQTPTFSDCMEDFQHGRMMDYLEVEHLKAELDARECEMRHYQRALAENPDDITLKRQLLRSESQMYFTKHSLERKFDDLELKHMESNIPEELKNGNALSFGAKKELSSYAQSIIRTHQAMADRDLDRAKWCQDQAERAEHRGDHSLAKNYINSMKSNMKSYHDHMDIIKSWKDG